MEALAWAAGLFDGEGCVYMAGHRVQMSLNNTHLPTVRRFHEIVGTGSVHATKNNSKPAHCKPMWAWHASCAKAEVVLRSLLPWLVTKREQAEVALFARQYAGTRGRYTPATDRSHLEWARKQLSQLKTERFEHAS